MNLFIGLLGIIIVVIAMGNSVTKPELFTAV